MKQTVKKNLKDKLILLLINKYFWMILIPDLFILYFIIRYSTILFMAFLLNDPDFRIAGAIIGLFILKAIIDLIISIKLIREKTA
jgi:hypothetical protein